jgi:2-methylisocitrate lyase-like PEP mutase family enzyme
MADQAEKAARFRSLHVKGEPLVMPNPWDAGTAKILASLDFKALATTSNGYAATLGRDDYGVTREEAISHSQTIVDATDLPVSADLENAFADEPEGVAETIRLAIGAGLAGCSVEDYTGDDDDPIYELELATRRIAAAAEAAGGRFVLTARAENHLHRRDDLADTIRRLQAYQDAGADVLYAPGLRRLEDISEVVSSLEKPVNVLVLPGAPSVSELAAAGVGRLSTGGGLAFAALGALVEAARELKGPGTYGWWDRARIGSNAADQAFT